MPSIFSSTSSSNTKREKSDPTQQSLSVPQSRPQEQQRRQSSFSRGVDKLISWGTPTEVQRGKALNDTEIKKQTGMTREEMNKWAAERLNKMNPHDRDALVNTQVNARAYGAIAGGEHLGAAGGFGGGF